MNRDAFIRDLRRYCRKAGIDFDYIPARGKGGHGVVLANGKFTTVRSGEISNVMKEVMLKQLDLPKDAI